MKRHIVRLGVVTGVVAAATMVAAPAYAAVEAQAFISLGVLNFVDKPDASNLHLTVRTVGSTIEFDAPYLVVPFAGCAYPSPTDTTKVACTGTITSFVVHGGDGDDTIDIDLAAPYATLVDQVYGDNGNDSLYGGRANSSLRGGDGQDFLSGRGGNDGLFGNAGADSMYGGTGTDVVDYIGITTVGVHASADGVIGDDGVPGEGDTIGADVEELFGTRFDDVLIGNASVNRLMGCGGTDELYGMAGNDYLEEGDGYYCGAGGPLVSDVVDGGTGIDTAVYSRHTSAIWVDLDGGMGDDGASGEGDSVLSIERLYGTSYHDVLIGSSGADTIDGGYGNDSIYGLGGSDALFGGEGADNLFGGAGSDSLDGGPGSSDHCELGAEGSFMTGCES